MLKKSLTFSHFTLFVALAISAIAAWYSVQGLTAIFAGAVIPIIIMGSILEIAKITTTVWLHRYWDRASTVIRTYLTIAVIVLAGLTSMGVFGLLSKAHSDQGAVSGDVLAKIELIDQRINYQKEIINEARKTLSQLDKQVDETINRTANQDNATGINRSINIRKAQARERDALALSISGAQKEIEKLNTEKAPLTQESRKIEAEIGPIKYIAALIYGSTTDTTVLESAVRFVIILIVVVFDPLAIILILAANTSIKWDRERKNPEDKDTPEQTVTMPIVTQEESDFLHGYSEQTLVEERDHTEVSEPEPDQSEPPKESKILFDNFYKEVNYDIAEMTVDIKSLIAKSKEMPSVGTSDQQAPQDPVEPENVETKVPLIDPSTIGITEALIVNHPKIIETENVTMEIPLEEYVMYEGKQTSVAALKSIRPDIVSNLHKPEILFGTKFPLLARANDIFTRIDVVPNRTFKFDKTKWVEVDRSNNFSYLTNFAYLQHIITSLESGEYSPDDLTPTEREAIEAFLNDVTNKDLT